jgi:Mannosyltransferase (PIG-V)
MRSALRAILPGFAVTRLALCAIAVFAVLRLPIDAIEAKGFHLAPQPSAWLEAWARYDACWYVTIAEQGYRRSIGPISDMRSAFFPLFPGLVAALTPVVGLPMLAAVIVSNTCFLTFLVLLWKLVQLDWGADVARRTMWIYLLFPSAFFLSGAYSESVLLAVTAGAVLMSRRRRWLMAGLLAGLATLARPAGVVAVAPILAEYVAMRRGENPDTSRLPLVAIVAPAMVAMAGYLVFASWAFGDPLANLSMETSVRGGFAPPWQPFLEMWRAGPMLHEFNNSLVDAALALIAVAALPAIFTKVRLSYGWYALLVVMIPLSGSLMSFNRLLLPSFPHAILLARAVRRPSIAAAILIPLGLLEAVLMTAFATWHWVA